ncbi:hypothetical protein BXZ70DRAFT_268016 [Cristinia sonorae]|uniref:Uncharacterized protein n=1 Tax=Cristinia sonorae TaxID=1940300 RepID=A0A8K0UYE9_9AGAR|nr:hypothetical protein BXZ70DRAFT_268016 [Cristinia sonorae]
MLTHRGFSAWITCNGSILPEYDIQLNEETGVAKCWIPSYDGQPFTVHWKDHGGYVDTTSYIYLDGQMVPGRFLFGFGETEKSAARLGTDTQLPFMFAMSSEDGEESNEDNEQHLIQLKIKRVTRIGPSEANEYKDAPKPRRSGRGKHHVQYGGARPAPAQQPKTWRTKPYDPNEPIVYVAFQFHYAPMDTLIAQGVVTAESGDSADVSDDGEDDHGGEEVDDQQADTLRPTLPGKRKAPLTPSPSPGPSTKRQKPSSRNSSMDKWDLLSRLDTDIPFGSQDSDFSFPTFSFDSPLSIGASSQTSVSEAGSSKTSPKRSYYR